MSKNYKIILDDKTYYEAVDHIKNNDILAYDVETTGLNVRKDKIIGLAFSGKEGVGYYYPVYEWKGDELRLIESCSLSKAKVLVKHLSEKKLVMHNASFDCRMTTNNYNIDLTKALHCDTILLKHSVEEEGVFGLKDIAKKIQAQIGLDIDKAANQEQLEMIESIKDNGGTVTKEKYELYKADMMKIGIYACSDVDITLRVFNYYSRLLEAEKLTKFFYEDETMPLLKHVTIPMESRGVPLDLNLLTEASRSINIDIQKLEDDIQNLIKPLLPDFERWFLWLKYPPRRTGSFAQALAEFSKLDLPKTDSGRYSLTQANLEQLEPSAFKDYLLGGDYLEDEVVDKIQRILHAETGEIHMFNLSSKHHLKKLFFDILGETPISKTDKGSPQVDNLFLDSIKDKYEWMPLLLDYNKLTKIKGAYIDRFLESHEDGMFYPRFFQHRTISGRYGSDLQQLSRPMEPGQASDVVVKYNNLVRKFFISGDGYKFIDADFEALEIKVFAHVSGDKSLKDILLKGHDLYSMIAIAALKLEGYSADKNSDNYLGKVQKSIRQKAKSFTLGIPYGLESFKLSKDLDITQNEAQTIIDNYLNAFPKLADWMKRSENMCVNMGYVKSEAGRIRHMPTAKKIWFAHGEDILDSLKLWKKHHEAPKKYASMKYLRKQMRNYLNNSKNFQIQSLAASIVNRSAIAISKELARQGIDGYICVNVHDQLIIRIRSEHAERWKNIMQYIMENTYKISIPLQAPAAVGDNFYETH